MPAPGTWVTQPTDYSPKERNWLSPNYAGAQYSDTWIDPVKHFVPMLDIPDVIFQQLEKEAAPKSPGSTTAGSDSTMSSLPEIREQTSGRAAKRQRGRERRKHFKSLKRLESAFDERAAAVGAQVKLVVRNTFIDHIDTREGDGVLEVPLPVALFDTAAEIEQMRRDYRGHRVGHVKSTILCAEHAVPWLVL